MVSEDHGKGDGSVIMTGQSCVWKDCLGRHPAKSETMSWETIKISDHLFIYFCVSQF